jgi:hypothetical protein
VSDLPETMTITAAARRYGVQPEDIRALIAAGVAWTVPAPPGRVRPLVATRSLEEWVESGRPTPAGERREIATFPRQVTPARSRDAA